MSGAELWPFNGRPGCCKCGSKDIYTDFHDGGGPCSLEACDKCHSVPAGIRCEGGQVPHLRRCCRGCGFIWYEQPLDAMASAGGGGT